MSEKKRDLEKTRQLLIGGASLLMTRCTDPDEVTSRAIARESGVNPAMINYCFGSREGLLFEVFKKLLADAQQADSGLTKTLLCDLPPKQRVKELHFRMMKLMIANHSYAKAITRFILLNRNVSFGMETLPCITEHFSGRKSESECRFIAFELTSLHELAVLRYADLKQDFGIDLTDDTQLRRYVETSVDRFLD